MSSASSKASQALVKGFFQDYPGEAAAVLDGLSGDEILRLLKNESIQTAVKVFKRLNPDVAAMLIDQMNEDLFRRLFDELDPADGVGLLSRLHKDALENRLALLPEASAREYHELLSYPPGSAGSLMDPRVTSFSMDDTVEKVLYQIRTIPDRRIMDICVVNAQRHLLAVVSIQDVAVAQPAQRISNLAKGDPVSIHAMAPREDVVRLLDSRRLASLPVVDLDGKLLGIIRYDALVAATKQDATEDVQAMFGAGRDERALSRVSFAIKKRLPWLQVNLGTAFLAAFVVGLFEETIARITALAVFLPVVAGQSGNTGSQALAVTMRGLALREIRLRHWFRIVKKECSVGFLNGCVIALTTSLIAYLWMQSAGLSVVIGIAMILSMIIAGASGAIIPILLKSAGQDPAQSSSIILTTVTDVFGFLSFLGLARVFIGFLGV
jgi:magnesium transporter